MRSIVAIDHSPVTSTTVSTSACPDAAAPSAPSGMRQVAATENSVMLAWSPSSDNVGVVEYGLYASGLRVATSSDASATLTSLACGTSYLVAIDAADAAGNRSAQASLVSSAPPPARRATKPPSTPTGSEGHGGEHDQRVARLDCLRRTTSRSRGYGLYLAGKRTTETTDDQRRLRGPAVRHHATRWASMRSTPPASAPPSRHCPPRPPPAPPHRRRRRARPAPSPRRSRTASTAHRVRSTGAPSTTRTATRSRTTPARSSSTSTAPRC